MVMLEYTNFAKSRMTADINSTDTTVAVVDGNAFPSSGDFYIVIGNEVLRVTSRSGNNLTVVRGVPSTVHSLGDCVTRIISKTDLESYWIVRDSYPNRPSPGVAGRYFIATDCPLECYDDGTTWQSRIFGHNITQYDDTGFTWLNQGTATFETTYGFGHLNMPNDVTLQVRGRYMNAPATPYTVTAFYNYTQCNDASNIAGLIFRDSGTGKITLFGPSQAMVFRVAKYDSVTVLNSVYTLTWNSFPPGLNICNGMWIRMTDNGTNRIYQYSMDNFYWDTIYQHGRTDFHTPNQIGYAMNAQHGFGGRMNIYSWLVN